MKPGTVHPGLVVVARLARRTQVVPIERQIWPARCRLLLVHHGGSAYADAVVLDTAAVAVSVQDLRDQLAPTALTGDLAGRCAWPPPRLRVLRAVTGEADQVGASRHWARTSSPRHCAGPLRR